MQVFHKMRQKIWIITVLVMLAALCAQADGGEVAAVRHEVLGFGEDWFAAAEPYGKPEDADADAAWIPAAWREEGGSP